MDSAQIRRTFTEFFVDRGHAAVPSASLVPSSYDPSVLLTTAGMQPFKPYFLGQETPPSVRLTSVQKCFRTPDIDEVGSTARHCTFFEMLGNFSFGDYFKQGAIEMAWELVTKVFALDPERLWVTVHEGDPKLGLGLDQEAVDLWMAVGVPRERIVPLGEDNFWKAGPTGPCGPCSEIYYDRGPEFGEGPGNERPGDDGDRYLEFYNLVFMQYDRDEHGTLTPLPQQNIDTGMGLERIAAILQGNVSVFGIDTMQRIINWAEAASGIQYGSEPRSTRALNILADHGRGMVFLTSDGVIPSNEGRGYVLRRIIRRAIQQAERLGLYEGGAKGVLRHLCDQVVAAYGDAYPDLVANGDAIRELLTAEEERFLRTLSKGGELLASVLADVPEGGTMSGADAFKLHDTFGFPIELTAELAAEAGRTVDESAFLALMREQRERARAAAGGSGIAPDVIAGFVRSGAPTEFVGYESTRVETQITAYSALESGMALAKLAASPFYAEGGGQVSDEGTVLGPNGHGRVLDVVRFEDDQVLVLSVDGDLRVGEPVTAQVDGEARAATQANHTATHLLHAALRHRLGDHVKQAGSLVSPDKLRFDFTHTSSLTPEDLQAIEDEVNARIGEALDVRWSVIPIDEAREAGAMMLFGEKYGDEVRLVEVAGDVSKELCGGTHVQRTSDIRLMLVTSESSVAANTRRIEAVTGAGALTRLRSRAQLAEQAAAAVGTEVDHLPERVTQLARRARELEKELTGLKSGAGADAALDAAEQFGGVNVVAYRDDALSADELIEVSDRLKGKLDPAVVLLGSAADGKVSLVASASQGAVDSGIDAGQLIREMASLVGGGGGGRPTMARAGGKDASRLDEALNRGRTLARERLDG